MAKKHTSRSSWTVVFLNREGFMLPVQPGQRKAIRQAGTEAEITREVEDLMKVHEKEEVGLAGSTYCAFIMKGDVHDAELEETAPKFVVYEGGQTHVFAGD